MPFSHVSNSYQPEQLNKLTEAFDLAWSQIMGAYGPATDFQLEQLRQRLANFIVACACRGEFEPEKLAQTALFITRCAACYTGTTPPTPSNYAALACGIAPCVSHRMRT